jgi:hypothetical protein
MNGALMNVVKLAALSAMAAMTACCRSPRVKSVSFGSSWFSRMRE